MSTKLMWYVYPCIVPLCLLAAIFLGAFLQNQKLPWFILCLGLCVAAVGTGWFIRNNYMDNVRGARNNDLQTFVMEQFDRKAEVLLHGEGPVNRRVMSFCGLFFDTFWYLPDAVNEDLESRYEDIWKEWESYRESKFDDMVALLKEGVDKGEYRKVNLPVVRQCVFYAAQGLTDPAFLREMNMTGKDVLEILEDIMLKGLEKQEHGQSPEAPMKEGEKSK